MSCLVEHAEIARAVTREAYRAGAQHVVVLYSDLHVRRAAIELGPESELGWSAPYLLDWYKRWPTENPAVISLTGNPSPELMKDLDPALVGRSDPRELRATMTDNIGGRHVNWVIVAAPNPGWATEVFGEPDVERLWEAVAVATRLDEPDPVAAWRAHIETPAGASRRAQRACLRRDPLSRPRHGSHGGARACRALAVRCIRDRTRHHARAEPPDRGGLHEPRLAACRGSRPLDVSARHLRDEGHRSRVQVRGAARSSTSRPSRVPRSCARNSPRTSRRRTSASSRSWTAPHP